VVMNKPRTYRKSHQRANRPTHHRGSRVLD